MCACPARTSNCIRSESYKGRQTGVKLKSEPREPPYESAVSIGNSRGSAGRPIGVTRPAGRAMPGRRVGADVLLSTPLLGARPPASPAGIVSYLILVALVVVVVLIVLKLAWKSAVVAIVVLAALWLLGAVAL